MKRNNFMNGNLHSSYPWSKEESTKFGYTKYTDINGCDICTSPGHKIRFVDGDKCVGCLAKNLEDIWPLWAQGEPSRPDPWCINPVDANRLGLDWYYDSPSHPRLCEKRPHIRKTHIVTGRCVECEAEEIRAKAAARGPRAIARAAGRSTYIPVDSCPDCGQIAERNVNTNSCSGCKKDDDRLSASRIFAKDNPDFIMSRSDAKEFGFTLYRTGEYCKKGHNSWRYVSTGNCIQCLT